MAKVVNYIILTIVYVVGIGPTSIIGKLLGKKFLILKSKNPKTYWVPKNTKKKQLEKYYRMH